MRNFECATAAKVIAQAQYRHDMSRTVLGVTVKSADTRHGSKPDVQMVHANMVKPIDYLV